MWGLNYISNIRKVFKGILALKSMKTKTITFQRYNNIINKYNQLRTQGLKPIIKKNRFKIVLGCVCLGIAIIPNGTGIIMYPLGFYLLGIGLKDIEELKRITKNKIRGVRFRT